MAVAVESTQKVRKSSRDKAIAKLAAKSGQSADDVEKVVSQVGASDATVVEAAKQMPAIVRDDKVSAVQQAAADSAEQRQVKEAKVGLAAKKPVTDKGVIKAAAKAIAQTAPAAPVGDLIATCYKRDGSSKMSGFGALVQTPAMAGTLKGRWCRHEHATADEAIACATTDIKSGGALSQSLRKAAAA